MDRRASGDQGRPVSVPRTSSASSWTGSDALSEVSAASGGRGGIVCVVWWERLSICRSHSPLSPPSCVHTHTAFPSAVSNTPCASQSGVRQGMILHKAGEARGSLSLVCRMVRCL